MESATRRASRASFAPKPKVGEPAAGTAGRAGSISAWAVRLSACMSLQKSNKTVQVAVESSSWERQLLLLLLQGFAMRVAASRSWSVLPSKGGGLPNPNPNPEP
jgi:hypothetical protein